MHISAEVILKSKSGKSIFEKDAVITSDTISNYVPKDSSLQTVKNILDSLGFQTVSGPYSVTITGSVHLFESVFKIKLSSKENPDVPIPNTLKDFVEKIIFSEPVMYF